MAISLFVLDHHRIGLYGQLGAVSKLDQHFSVGHLVAPSHSLHKHSTHHPGRAPDGGRGAKRRSLTGGGLSAGGAGRGGGLVRGTPLVTVVVLLVLRVGGSGDGCGSGSLAVDGAVKGPHL